ncbi:MAG TPA: hypothetical protein VL053_00230 [Arachidicoccus sp.]|nr:hypothetical protein [Arachidicoccus sp.]
MNKGKIRTVIAYATKSINTTRLKEKGEPGKSVPSAKDGTLLLELDSKV